VFLRPLMFSSMLFAVPAVLALSGMKTTPALTSPMLAVPSAMSDGVSAAARHAKVVRTSPAANAVLAASPDHVTLEMSEAVELKGSKLTVAVLGGMPVALGALRHEPGTTKTVRADVSAPLAPGAYIVAWRLMSKDGHVVSGGMQFKVGAAK
jgi:methionine-rich copper-binding protein CopC